MPKAKSKAANNFRILPTILPGGSTDLCPVPCAVFCVVVLRSCRRGQEGHGGMDEGQRSQEEAPQKLIGRFMFIKCVGDSGIANEVYFWLNH